MMRTHMKKSNGIEVSMQNTHRYFTGYISGLILLMFLSSALHAEDIITNDIVELSAGIGYYDFDADRNLDDSAMASLSLGLHFSRSWALLLHYSALNTRRHDNGISRHVDMQKYHVDVHRFFNIKKHLRPYLVAGFGQMDLISEDVKSNKNMFNAGVGLYYRMTPSWSIRTDVRIFARTDSSYNDNAVTLTLGYRFSGGEK